MQSRVYQENGRVGGALATGIAAAPAPLPQAARCDLSFERAVEFAAELIRIPSLPGEEGGVARRIVEELRALGFDDAGTDRAGNVVGRIAGRGSAPPVMLSSHMDVVDVGDEDAWEHPPYAGVVADGCLHGRGAMDLKGPLALHVYTAARFVRERPAGDLLLVFSVFEEKGGWGMMHVMESLAVRPGAVILAEATGCDLCTGHRGHAELAVEIHGRAAHASAPERGRNPNHLLPHLLLALQDVAETQPLHSVLGRATLTPTMVESWPRSGNVIPDRIRVTLDMRVLPGWEEQQAVGQLRALLAERMPQVEGLRVEVLPGLVTHRAWTGWEDEHSNFTPGFLMDHEHPVVRAAVRALHSALGRPPVVRPWLFGTDGGHSCGTHGVPTIGFAPGIEALAHTNRERLDLSSARLAFDAYPALIRAVQAAACIHQRSAGARRLTLRSRRRSASAATVAAGSPLDCSAGRMEHHAHAAGGEPPAEAPVSAGGLVRIGDVRARLAGAADGSTAGRRAPSAPAAVPSASPDQPCRAGQGDIQAHHGEILQGIFYSADGALEQGLVTLPCSLYATRARFRPLRSGPLRVEPADRARAHTAARLTLDALGCTGWGGSIRIDGNVPLRWGCGSSTADVLTTIRAVADAFDVVLEPEWIARLAVAAETASDSLMYGPGRAVLFAQRRGSKLLDLGGPLPAVRVLGFNTDDRGSETLALPPIPYSVWEIEAFQAILGLLCRAVEQQDAVLLGRVATASTVITQRHRPKRDIPRVLRLAREVGAAGTQMAHSGTVVGLIFDPADEPAGRITHARRALQRMGVERSWEFSTDSGLQPEPVS